MVARAVAATVGVARAEEVQAGEATAGVVRAAEMEVGWGAGAREAATEEEARAEEVKPVGTTAAAVLEAVAREAVARAGVATVEASGAMVAMEVTGVELVVWACAVALEVAMVVAARVTAEDGAVVDEEEEGVAHLVGAEVVGTTAAAGWVVGVAAAVA